MEGALEFVFLLGLLYWWFPDVFSLGTSRFRFVSNPSSSGQCTKICDYQTRVINKSLISLELSNRPLSFIDHFDPLVARVADSRSKIARESAYR